MPIKNDRLVGLFELTELIKLYKKAAWISL